MIAPKCCPVCGNESIQHVVRSATVRIDGDDNPITGTLAYRCNKGHLFLIASADPNGNEDDPASKDCLASNHAQ